jgi:hypothetical protein
VPNIEQKVVQNKPQSDTLTLRNLERDGLISRDLFPEIRRAYEPRKKPAPPDAGLDRLGRDQLGAGEQGAVSVPCEVDARLRFAYRIYAREVVAGTMSPFNAVQAARESM